MLANVPTERFDMSPSILYIHTILYIESTLANYCIGDTAASWPVEACITEYLGDEGSSQCLGTG